MSDYLVVEGIDDMPSLNGRYEFSLTDMLSVGTAGSLTNREAHEIKVMSQVRLGELEDALMAGDNSVYVALAALILRRHHKVFDMDLLWDAPAGATVKFDFEVTRPVPPAEPAETPEPAEDATT